MKAQADEQTPAASVVGNKISQETGSEDIIALRVSRSMFV
jgi:hypothetical protein